MSLFKKVLMIGGPVDGKWLEVSQSEHTIMIPDPESMKADFSALFKGEPIPPSGIKAIRYFVRPVEFQPGFKIWVALRDTDGLRDQDNCILKAILQRDVATELGLFNGR